LRRIGDALNEVRVSVRVRVRVRVKVRVRVRIKARVRVRVRPDLAMHSTKSGKLRGSDNPKRSLAAMTSFLTADMERAILCCLQLALELGLGLRSSLLLRS